MKEKNRKDVEGMKQQHKKQPRKTLCNAKPKIKKQHHTNKQFSVFIYKQQLYKIFVVLTVASPLQ